MFCMSDNLPIQPTINMGIVGHVDHGKTTLTKLLSGKWTDTHSEEIKRGITIKLGYTNFTIYTNKDKSKYSIKKNDDVSDAIRKVSIVDAPGHESFMATMISGAAIMDCALLVVAANEKCPQPQTIEHLKTLEISDAKKVIVIQNKIDLVTKDEAIENYKQIRNFLKGSFAEDAPIVPMSAYHGANLSNLLKFVYEKFDVPKRYEDIKESRMYLVRSFDINKPGDDYKTLQGGILGGSIKFGKFSVGDEIEIRPGVSYNKDGKTLYKPIYAKITGLMSDKDKLDSAIAGGSIAVMTELDPSLTKSDSLVGQIVGPKGTLCEPLGELTFEHKFFDKIVTSNGDLEVKPVVPNEPLMIIVNSYTTVGIVTKVNPKEITIKLKRPVMAFNNDRVVIFRRFEGNKWRICGYGITLTQ